MDLGTVPGDVRLGGSAAHAWIGAALGRGIPTLDDRPGGAPGPHRTGGHPGFARIGVVGRRRYRDMDRLVPDDR